MDIAMGAMSTILPKLGDLLKDEYKLQKSVRGEIMFLETELEAMQTALAQLSEAPIDQPPSRQDKRWATEVLELSYDLEDKIDEFLVRIDAPEQLNGLRAFIDRSLRLLTRVSIRHKIGSDINTIKTRITEVCERRRNYKVPIASTKPTRPSVDSLRLSALHKRASELIGTKEKANDLVEKLIEDDGLSNPEPKVISIVGMGGLGKTTLANVVYQKLECQFDCGAFVSVSLNPKMDHIFKNMLHQLDSDRYKNINGETWDETQLINELRGLLSNKRYCIVVDDIWKTSVWENIFRALNKSKGGSIIITTTRILDVAKQTGSVYVLKPLSPDDSRKLFYLRIFGTEETCLPKELAKESENILRKCGGVPLAIITVASMLANKRETEYASEYWSKVCKSMGSGLQNSSDAVKDMRSILSVSYHDLPLHLRTCFLYLSMYPEDYEIRTEDLIWKWIGEGFIQRKLGKNMFEVGEDYIHDLINRSLIQPSYIDSGSKKACRYFNIHDMVLDLVTFMSTEEHFLTKLGFQEHEFIPNKIRRLSLQTSIEEDGKEFEKKNFAHVRSLIVFGSASNLPPEHSIFPILRVLDLTLVKVGNQHFTDICNLLHLRYLALPGSSITDIPKDIGKLKLLMVLKINGADIVKLPPSFARLRQLVYLQFGKLATVPEWFGYLKSLQEIVGFIHLKSPTMLHVLGELTELRRVSLFFQEWDESYENVPHLWLSRMVSLKYLTITIKGEINIDLGSRWDMLSPGPQQLETIEIHSAIYSVPRWMLSLCSLSILRIYLLELEERDLQILGSIPSLSHLAITVKEPITRGRERKSVLINAHSFFGLKNFELYKAISVVFMKGSMDKLQSLVLGFGVREMMDYGHFDFGLKNLSSLMDVRVQMDCFNANPQERSAVMAAIQNEIDAHPNIPKIRIDPVLALKVNKSSGKQRSSRALKAISKLDGVASVTIVSGQDGDRRDKLVVFGMVDPTTVIETLKKKSIQAEEASFLQRYIEDWKYVARLHG